MNKLIRRNLWIAIIVFLILGIPLQGLAFGVSTWLFAQSFTPFAYRLQGVIKGGRYFSPSTQMGKLSVEIPFKHPNLSETSASYFFNVGFNQWRSPSSGGEYTIDVVGLPSAHGKPSSDIYPAIKQVMQSTFEAVLNGNMHIQRCRFVSIYQTKAYQCTASGTIHRLPFVTVATSMLFKTKIWNVVNIFGTENNDISHFHFKRYNQFIRSIRL